MNEPYLPIPDPEPLGSWDPSPPRCPECGTIIETHPASRLDGRREGHCPEHGQVLPVYRFSESEKEEEEL